MSDPTPTLPDYLPLLFQGIPVTLEVTLSAMIVVVFSGFAFGFQLANASMSGLLT